MDGVCVGGGGAWTWQATKSQATTERLNKKLLAILREQRPTWRDHHGQRARVRLSRGRPGRLGHGREGRTEERKGEETGGWGQARLGEPCSSLLFKNF